MAENTQAGKNNYQYWGLVGKGASEVFSPIVEGYAQSAGLEIQAGGYFMTADSMELQAEQETINATMMATARVEQFNKNEAANIAMGAAMGKTGENTTISDVNREANYQDTQAMKSAGLMRNISARSSASASRSAGRQSKIQAKGARKTAIFSSVLGAAKVAGSAAMIGG